MPWHHRHFPTFGPFLRRVYLWYKARDLFEKIGINVIAWCGVIYIAYLMTLAPPAHFPSGAYIKVVEGSALSEVADTLEERGVISSSFLFKWTIRIFGSDRAIKAGTYYFGKGENLVWIAARVLGGDFETSPVRVTIFEGSTNADIAKLLSQKVPEFNAGEFLRGAREGYMFPDTYYFRPGDDAQTVLGVFANNYEVHIRRVQDAIKNSGHSEEEIIIMASLLEKEASKFEDRRAIAGVLWRRIAVGMPLQVDAVFPYIIGKNTFELTKADLKIDSLYNTYKYKGLPIGPIANPGLDAILAAATPVKTSYLYYLSDKGGNFHFATTYEQHMAYRAKYWGE